jgi:hypothetical protein
MKGKPQSTIEDQIGYELRKHVLIQDWLDRLEDLLPSDLVLEECIQILLRTISVLRPNLAERRIRVYSYRNPELIVGQTTQSGPSAELVESRLVPDRRRKIYTTSDEWKEILDWVYELISVAWQTPTQPLTDWSRVVGESFWFRTHMDQAILSESSASRLVERAATHASSRLAAVQRERNDLAARLRKQRNRDKRRRSKPGRRRPRRKARQK